MFAFPYRAVLVLSLISIAVRTNGFAQQKQDASRTAIAQAEEYFSNGNFTSAVYLLDEAIKKNPNNIAALTLLGRAYLAVKQFQEAERFFQRAFAIDEKNADANLGLGIILLLDAKPERAKWHALVALNDESTRVDALNVLSQIAANEEKLDEARQYCEQILAIDSTHFDALSNLGVFHQKTGNGAKALSYFQKALAFHPDNPSAYHNLGALYSNMGRLHDAIIALNKAARLDSLEAKSVRTLGLLYLQSSLFREAVATFQRAIEREFLDVESRVGKALAFWSLQEYDNALEEINAITAMGLRFKRMELFLANLYFQKKDYDQAIAFAKEDKKQNPAQAEGHYLLGVLYRRKAQQEKADFEFEEVAAITKQNPQAPLTFNVNSYFSSEEKP